MFLIQRFFYRQNGKVSERANKCDGNCAIGFQLEVDGLVLWRMNCTVCRYKRCIAFGLGQKKQRGKIKAAAYQSSTSPPTSNSSDGGLSQSFEAHSFSTAKQGIGAAVDNFPNQLTLSTKEVNFNVIMNAMINLSVEMLGVPVCSNSFNNETEAWFHCVENFNGVAKGCANFMSTLSPFLNAQQDKRSEMVSFRRIDASALMMPLFFAENGRDGIRPLGPTNVHVIKLIPEFEVAFLFSYFYFLFLNVFFQLADLSIRQTS